MKKTISITMMMLIVMLPVCFAQELTIQKLQGKNNAKGYARVQDNLIIEVLVKIPGETNIGKEQVRLYIGDTYTFFDSCTAEGTQGYFKCSYSDMQFESYQPIDFLIELRDNDGNIVASETKTLVIDNITPIVKKALPDPKLTSGPITVSYSIEDYATSYNDAQCSGIKEIRITAGTQSIVETGALGECKKNDIIEMNIQQTGTVQVCIAATDYVGYASLPVCDEIVVDKNPPQIEELLITDNEGTILTHVHEGEERLANIYVKITDDGELEYDSIRGNFVQLNPSLPDAITPDTYNGDSYLWRNIGVSEVTNCKITITASDTIGNTATQQFPCNIRPDDVPPIFEKVIIQAQKDDLPLYGYGTELIIELSDKDNLGQEGIGFNNKDVYLDLSELGLGNQQAYECNKNGNWYCKWILTPGTIPEQKYLVKLTASDDLGNTMTDTPQFEIIYDNQGPTKPQIIEQRIITGETGETYPEGAVKGNYLQYVVKSSDFLTASANFSAIGGEEYAYPTGCDAETCTFESQVKLTGPYTANISFTFYDEAFNSASTSTIINVYGIAGETTQNFWNIGQITCTPRLIDRSAAAIIPAQISCQVPLITPRTDVQTLAVIGPQLEECTGDVDLFSEVYITNNQEETKLPFLFLVMNTQDYSQINETTITCPITIKTKIKQGTQYYAVPQTQKIQVPIKFKYYTEQDLYGNINDKIENTIENTKKLAEWMNVLGDILFYTQKICELRKLITSVISSLFLAAGAIGGFGEFLEKSVVGSAIGFSMKQTASTICAAEETISGAYVESKNVLDKLCAFANCEAKGGVKGIESLGELDKWLGGGAPWCKDIKEYLKSNFGLTPGINKLYEKAGIDVDIKDSIVLSSICICLPGIIQNVQKMSEIECFKAVCYKDYVKDKGYPITMCDSEYQYLWCTYVIGEIFALFPIAKLFDKLIDAVIKAVSNPIIIIGMAIGEVCRSTCNPNSVGTAYIACALYKTLTTSIEAIAGVTKMVETESEYWTPMNHEYCKRVQEIVEEENE